MSREMFSSSGKNEGLKLKRWASISEMLAKQGLMRMLAEARRDKRCPFAMDLNTMFTEIGYSDLEGTPCSMTENLWEIARAHLLMLPTRHRPFTKPK
jgi:hypothetical protein